jgi:hypothetical protein
LTIVRFIFAANRSHGFVSDWPSEPEASGLDGGAGAYATSHQAFDFRHRPTPLCPFDVPEVGLSSSSSPPPPSSPLKKIEDFLYTRVAVAMCALGLVGNAASVAVLASDSFPLLASVSNQIQLVTHITRDTLTLIFVHVLSLSNSFKLSCSIPRNNFLPSSFFPSRLSPNLYAFSSSTFDLPSCLVLAGLRYLLFCCAVLSVLYSRLSSLSLFVSSFTVVDRSFRHLCVTSKFVAFRRFFVCPCSLLCCFVISVIIVSSVEFTSMLVAQKKI